MKDTAISEWDFNQTEVELRFALANASQDVLIALRSYMGHYRSHGHSEAKMVTVRAAFEKWEQALSALPSPPQASTPDAALNERERAVALANRVLDRVNADPDDDLAVLARQLLRAVLERKDG